MQIEQAISMQGLTSSELVQAHLALARIVQQYGRSIAAQHHFEYPAELEQAVLAYVHKELALLGIEINPENEPVD